MNKDKKDEGQDYGIRRAYVSVDGQDIPSDSVEFLDIEEDGLTGRDLMTFNYKGKKYQSLVFIK